MYFLTDEACPPLALTEKRIQLDGRTVESQRSAELKKAMTEYIESFGVAELRALVKSVTKEQ